MAEIVMLAGSPSEPSRSTALLEYARRLLQEQGRTVELLRLRDLPATDLLTARFGSPDIQAATALVGAAQGVVVATPIYKAAYTGVLKAFLDLLPANALAGKTVLPLATGGAATHALALDYALGPVLMALGATHILRSIYIVDSQVQWSPGNEPQLAEALDTQLREALAILGEK